MLGLAAAAPHITRACSVTLKTALPAEKSLRATELPASASVMCKYKALCLYAAGNLWKAHLEHGATVQARGTRKQTSLSTLMKC